MLDASYNDNLQKLVCFALFTTHATTLCPFHPEVTIRVGDAAAETHAYYMPETSSRAMARAGSMEI